MSKDKIETASDALTDALRASGKTRRKRHLNANEVDRRPVLARNDLLPVQQLEYRDPFTLKRAARRARKTTTDHVAQIQRSIQRFGFVGALLISADDAVIVGHGLLEAALALGLDRVPCIQIEHLTPDEQRLFAIAHNRLGETGVWDLPELRIELQELVVIQPDLTITGFSETIIDLTLQEDDTDAAAAAALDRLPAAAETMVSRLGDVWVMDGHRLGMGDARDHAFVAQVMAGETARLAMPDAPYNLDLKTLSKTDYRPFPMGVGEYSRPEFQGFLTECLMAIERVLVAGGLVLAFIDHRSIDVLYAAARDAGLDVFNLLVWCKSNGGQGSLWRSQHELIVAALKPGGPITNQVQLGRDGRYRTNVLSYAGASSFGSEARGNLKVHVTPKPVALVADLILDVSHSDDCVLDTFSGCGTTLIACEKTRRRFRGTELDGGHVDAAVRRWEALTGKSAFLEETGESFAAAATRRQHEDEHSSAQGKPQDVNGDTSLPSLPEV